MHYPGVFSYAATAMAVDTRQLRSSPYTNFYQSFYLLRVPLSIGGQLAQITISNDGHLTIGCRYPAVSITFDSLISEVDTIVKEYGVKGVSNYWCEDVPLFELKMPSQDNLKRLLQSEERVQKELASRVAAKLAEQQRSSEPVALYAHTEVYMLTPRPENNDAHIVQVSSENLATCATLWKESEVFNFGALFRAFRMDRKSIPNQGIVLHLAMLLLAICCILISFPACMLFWSSLETTEHTANQLKEVSFPKTSKDPTYRCYISCIFHRGFGHLKREAKFLFRLTITVIMIMATHPHKF